MSQNFMKMIVGTNYADMYSCCLLEIKEVSYLKNTFKNHDKVLPSDFVLLEIKF